MHKQLFRHVSAAKINHSIIVFDVPKTDLNLWASGMRLIYTVNKLAHLGRRKTTNVDGMTTMSRSIWKDSFIVGTIGAYSV